MRQTNANPRNVRAIGALTHLGMVKLESFARGNVAMVLLQELPLRALPLFTRA